MLHQMGLQANPFASINAGDKLIEVRLYDAKRRQLQLGDIIEFQNLAEPTQKLKVRVVGLLRYECFADLFADFPPEVFGAESRSELDGIYKYYSADKEVELGVLGIRVDLILL